MMARSDARASAHFTYIWIIENVSKLTNIQLKSPSFLAYSVSDVKWHLALDVWGDFVCCLHSNETQRKKRDKAASLMDIEFSLLGADGSTLISGKGNKNYFEVPLMSQAAFMEKWTEFVPKKTLTVRCRIWRKRSKMQSADLCYARTKLKSFSRTILWPIEEFSAINSTVAEDFRKLGMEESKLYPLKNFIERRHFMGLVLYLKRNSDSEDVCVDFLIERSSEFGYSCEITILDVNAEVIVSEFKKNDSNYMGREIFNFRNLISKEKLISNRNLFLPNDVLLLRCSFIVCSAVISNEIEYCTPNVSTIVQSREELSMNVGSSDDDVPLLFEKYFFKDVDENYLMDFPVEQKSDSLSCNKLCPLKVALKYLQGDKTWSDVSLRVGTKVFPVHKNILSARSPVFKAMFSKDMEDNIIDIPDMDENTFCQLLQYMYTDTIENLQFENTLDLFKAAVDYQLFDLKDKCSDILSLADKFQDEKQEEAVGDSGYDKKINVREDSKQIAKCNLS